LNNGRKNARDWAIRRKPRLGDPQRLNAKHPGKDYMDLKPDWVAGFVDGEGCFYVGIYRHPEMTVGYQVLPEFRVVQHERDIQVLYGLKRFFGAGVVRKNREDRYELRIRKLSDLKKAVDFFEKHPLKTKKRVDFLKFAKILRWMGEGKHLEKAGLIRIIEIAAAMNREDKKKALEILKELKKEPG
jgi:hypothetical protein